MAFHEQAARAYRGVGAHLPRAEFKPQPQLVNDGGRQQRDQIGEARQSGGNPFEDFRTGNGAAEFATPFKDAHSVSSPGQVRGRDETVVPATDDDHVRREHQSSNQLDHHLVPRRATA